MARLGAVLVLVFAALVLLVFLVVPGYSQQTQTLRAQWEIEGPPAPAGGTRPPFEVATAQGYTYKIYQVGSAVGEVLLGVQCTTTADAFVKTCAATVPTAFSAPGLMVDLTAIIDGIETPHSTAATVPPLFVPPAPPRNLRLLRYVGTIPVPTGVNPATPGAGGPRRCREFRSPRSQPSENDLF